MSPARCCCELGAPACVPTRQSPTEQEDDTPRVGALGGGGGKGVCPGGFTRGGCCSRGGGTTPLPSSAGAQQRCWALCLGFSGHGQPHGSQPPTATRSQHDHGWVTPSSRADAVGALLALPLGPARAGISPNPKSPTSWAKTEEGSGVVPTGGWPREPVCKGKAKAVRTEADFCWWAPSRVTVGVGSDSRNRCQRWSRSAETCHCLRAAKSDFLWKDTLKQGWFPTVGGCNRAPKSTWGDAASPALTGGWSLPIQCTFGTGGHVGPLPSTHSVSLQLVIKPRSDGGGRGALVLQQQAANAGSGCSARSAPRLAPLKPHSKFPAWP